MDAAEWKETRIRLTPTFTSGKIKMMIPLVQSVSEQMITEINKLAEKDADIDIKEVTTSFTINTLANCALGIETKSGNDIFTEMTKKHFYPTDCGGILRFTLMNRFPELCGKLGLPFVNKETADFFRKIFRDSMNYRDESGISRPDFLELLIKLKNQSRNTPKPLSDDYLTAQVFLFFIASLDTSSSAISFALYELANNPDMQERTREEIIQVLEKHNDQITSDCLKEMKYLNQVINETLRLYPSVTNLERRCVRNYKIAGTELIVERGVYITIPLYGIHRDPDFYQDPERFDPDKFNERNKKYIKSQTYFPFGLGPRNCVGNRFGIMVTQVALIEVLRMFRISVSSSTILPFEMDKQTLILVLKNPILLKAEKINNECDNLMI
ncbi:cytochrome P450 6a2 isoform X1 [Leptinotarsa decemlineata]|uniref:cytochrome P450 6a2 isoform X1 n=1 Tax=Leptinotarsa decemlineata TaxID=7539 RepID=UPI003D30BD35